MPPAAAAACAAARGAPCRRGAAARSARRPPRCVAAASAAPLLPPRRKLVGLGSAGVDFLAAVAAFPAPDAKIRTEALEVQGGGNNANALSAAARLGLAPALWTVLGGDANADAIRDGLAAEGVDTAAVVCVPGAASPFTYIIVDQAGATRTCIHTPGART
jgi:sugar/nucleoside kinase (ribokinase family)